MTLAHFREILRYVPNFRGETFVLAVDGDVVKNPNFANLILDVGVLRSLSVNVVVVHGIGAQLRKQANECGVVLSNDDGTGITDDATMELALATAGETVQRVLGSFRAACLPAVSTNAVVVRPAGVLDGVDSQNTGKVISVDVVMLSSLLNQRLVPILPPLGYDHQGVAFRVNSDSLAIAVAVALHAKKVIFASVLAGVEFGEELVRQMTVSQAEQLLRDESDRIATPMISKLKHAAAGCRDGISRIHLINGTAEEGLLAEVFSNEGIGTLVYSDDYQVIRSATLDDVSFIHSLVKDAASDDEVIARTQIEIEARIDDHYVLEIDDNPVACVAMHSHPECGKAELASLVVSEGHRKFGLASRLIEHIEEEARKQQVRHLFCLSTQAFSYFKRKAGFEDGKPDDLPTERRQRWASNGRNSKILTKLLT